MTPEEFRAGGTPRSDWIADYQRHVETLPVLSQVQPGEIRAQLPAAAPEHGEPFDAILADVDRLIMPGITHWQSAQLFRVLPGQHVRSVNPRRTCSRPASGCRACSGPPARPAPSWRRTCSTGSVDLLALPAKFKSSSTGGGVIQDTASSAVLAAVLAARERATDFQSNERGADGRLVAYGSTQTHSSVEKAVKIAGLGRQNLRLIEVDERFALRPEALARQIEADRQAGLVPCFVAATLGTTSSNAFDPLPEIGRICREQRLWLHVDGAMCGTAALCPEYRHFQAGLELADSYAFNPHKWMFTNSTATVSTSPTAPRSSRR